MASRINWTNVTWNPVTGCTRISAGCEHCYIERTPPFRMNGRFFRDRDGLYSNEIGSTTGVSLHPERLDWPLRKRSWRGKRVFVCSLSDLFHDAVPDEFIGEVWAVMALTPDVTYQVLTKRPARMRSVISGLMDPSLYGGTRGWSAEFPWPLPNVHIGVTVEDQERADLRIPLLLDTPAAVRWLSVEPMLGPVDLRDHVDRWSDDDPGTCDWGHCNGTAVAVRRDYTCDDVCMLSVCAQHRGIDWAVIGGESGPGARPMRDEWARSIVAQCRDAGVPVFVKQMGSAWAKEHGLRGKAESLDEIPEYLRVREFPGDAS